MVWVGKDSCPGTLLPAEGQGGMQQVEVLDWRKKYFFFLYFCVFKQAALLFEPCQRGTFSKY